jgi:shikimate dehydrogenase
MQDLTPSATPARVMLGVAGWPVGHSRSPAMHGAALRAAGVPWRYVRLPISPERFAPTVRALPESGFRGINVTIPHKLAALALADEAAPAARAMGAANTLSFQGGAIRADNTDAGGLLDALGEPVAGLRCLVLGAGGSGRSAAWVLREAGAAEVRVWNRTAERADALARELGVTAAARPGPCDVLVQATSVGLAGEEEESALEALGLLDLAPPPTVVELVYGATPTPVQRWATRGGARVVDGLEMLVRQGARSFAIWTGREPDVDAMREAARAG